MKIAKHISFFYVEDRLRYVNKILRETNNYEHVTDVFIHTNYAFSKDKLEPYANGSINIVYHDVSNNELFKKNPFYFTWTTRQLMKEQCEDYDVFMYIEDDILVPKDALRYWFKYKCALMENNYNLGFLRIEIDAKGDEYTTDNATSPWSDRVTGHLKKTIIVDNETYIVNDTNPYCAFWIYDKKEFNKFVNSKYYDLELNNITGYGVPETVAIGLHGLETYWYKGTVIPMQNYKLHKSCRIYHLANNYVHRPGWWKLHLFDDVYVRS